MSKTIVVLAVLVAVAHAAINDANCGNSKVRGGKIVGGSSAEKGQYPWMISLQYLGLYHTCGATIIDDEWIMCAAHCFGNSQSPFYYSVRAGAWDISKYESQAQDYSLQKIYVHEDYSSVFIKNDISLMKLAQPLDLGSDYINRVCIPPSDPFDTDGRAAKIVGWGDTKNVSGQNLPDIQKQGDVTIQDETKCKENWDYLYTHSKQVCSISDDTAICVGDSGGPIHVINDDGSFTQVGISSFVSSNGCLNDWPNVFTRVSYFRDWIKKTTNLDFQ